MIITFPLFYCPGNQNSKECFGSNKGACVWTTNTLTTKLVWTAMWFMKCFHSAVRAQREDRYISNNLSSHHWLIFTVWLILIVRPTQHFGFHIVFSIDEMKEPFSKQCELWSPFFFFFFTSELEVNGESHQRADSVLLGLTGTALTWLAKRGLMFDSGREIVCKELPTQYYKRKECSEVSCISSKVPHLSFLGCTGEFSIKYEQLR